MDSLYDKIQVNYSEYEYYKGLSESDKVNFLMQLFDQALVASKGLDLSAFFRGLIDSEPDDEKHIETIYESPKYENDPNRVDVLIDENNIMIESNSLRAIKHVAYKFIESGYILQRDLETEKMFKRDKITKYMRIFLVIDQISNICTN
jgi:hypothetical protein